VRIRSALRATATLAAAATLLCGCNLGQAQNAILVDADSTKGPTQHIDPFTVRGAWQIKYTFDCTKQNSEGVLNADQFTIDVFDGDDNSTAFEHPQTTFVSVKRKGTLSFRTPGNYYLQVDTQCDWTLQVVDVSNGAVVSTTGAPHVRQPHGTVKFDVTFDSGFGPYSCDLTATSAPLCLVGDGTAGASPFGPLSMHRVVAVQGGTGSCTAATTTAMLTAANGDVLTVKSDKGQACPKSDKDSYTFTVTGGTGIFKGATGSGTIADSHGTSDRWSGTITFAQ
jgi:hypothetical protein